MSIKKIKKINLFIYNVTCCIQGYDGVQLTGKVKWESQRCLELDWESVESYNIYTVSWHQSCSQMKQVCFYVTLTVNSYCKTLVSWTMALFLMTNKCHMALLQCSANAHFSYNHVFNCPWKWMWLNI